MKPFFWPVLALFLLAVLGPTARGETRSRYQIDAIPDGYHLQTCDDCGVPDRQPHVHARDVYTFSPTEVAADEKARSVAWGDKQVDVEYDHLAANAPYVVAITYANETFNHRVQSIWAGKIQLQPPHALPKGNAERLIFRVPPEAIEQGKLHLQFRLEAQVNVVVSFVELWSTALSPTVIRISGASGMMSNLEGRVLNLAYDPDLGAAVQLFLQSATNPVATTETDKDGKFTFSRSLFDKVYRSTELRIVASHRGISAEQTVPLSDLFFDPIHYRPMPTRIAGIENPRQSLDGMWQIDIDASDDAISKPPPRSHWHDIHVPGQWLQEGFNVPEDKPALMSHEFTIPAEWKDHRIILRFDAIHAATQFWLNGKRLGFSENLFTPVEWDITDTARFGQINRLDLKMVVASDSERLSTSSGYTGRSLGGIDRSVKIFALPPSHIATMHLDAGLDQQYQNGDLKIDLGLQTAGVKGLSVQLHLLDASGNTVHHSMEGPIAIDSDRLHIDSIVANPLKWNAEQPNLYKLTITLKSGDQVLEQIDRDIGFRKIEVKGSQLYVNGVRVKLAGIARHEIDPLTGRADTARHADEDVRLFKNANLNYIRTSHYPPTDEFLAAADRLGMYVECEAPFCWVAPLNDLTHLKTVLTTTAARIDFCHTHPSIIVWSIANESNWSRVFDMANKLTKSLDPTRPTTFNHPFSNADAENCDIVNRHYLGMPFDAAVPNDPRPFLHGECFFEVYHSRTDVGIDPGLRELWAMGNADPNAPAAKALAQSLGQSPGLQPGIYPGAWTHIIHSKRFVGSVIWAGIDDIMFTHDGERYSSENGNAYWGILDGWRRPKPEYWLTKCVFSPVWFPMRTINWNGTDTSVKLPVENRYSFTDFSALHFEWSLGQQHGTIPVRQLPETQGGIDLPIPQGTKPGDAITLNVSNSAGDLITAVNIHLGQPPVEPLPSPEAGAPTIESQADDFVIQGEHFAWVLNKHTGDFTASSPTQHSVITHFPRLHVTRFDFGDLATGFPPYAVFPDQKSRIVDQVTAEPTNAAASVTVKDHYHDFSGQVRWLIDRHGVGDVSYDYTYTGSDLFVRELGAQLAMKRDCDRLTWHRRSEWDIFPDEAISRTVGTALATRDAKYGPANAPEFTRPTWPWSLDQTDLGTNDFRAVKLNVLEASLRSSAGEGIAAHAHADVHVRACLAPDGVLLHLLSQCGLTPLVLHKGEHLTGHFSLTLDAP